MLVRLKGVYSINDLFRKAKGDVVEGKGSGETSVDIAGQLVAKNDGREFALEVMFPVLDGSFSDVYEVFFEEH